jgi:hypothetical protein
VPNLKVEEKIVEESLGMSVEPLDPSLREAMSEVGYVVAAVYRQPDFVSSSRKSRKSSSGSPPDAC